MGEWQPEAKMSFDVETVLSQLTQNEKIALLSGKFLEYRPSKSCC